MLYAWLSNMLTCSCVLYISSQHAHNSVWWVNSTHGGTMVLLLYLLRGDHQTSKSHTHTWLAQVAYLICFQVHQTTQIGGLRRNCVAANHANHSRKIGWTHLFVCPILVFSREQAWCKFSFDLPISTASCIGLIHSLPQDTVDVFKLKFTARTDGFNTRNRSHFSSCRASLRHEQAEVWRAKNLLGGKSFGVMQPISAAVWAGRCLDDWKWLWEVAEHLLCLPKSSRADHEIQGFQGTRYNIRHWLLSHFCTCWNFVRGAHFFQSIILVAASNFNLSMSPWVFSFLWKTMCFLLWISAASATRWCPPTYKWLINPSNYR